MNLKAFLPAILVVLLNCSAIQASQNLKLPGATHAVAGLEAITYLDRGSFYSIKEITTKSSSVTASFYWLGVALADDADMKQAYLNFRKAKPEFATALNPAKALGQCDVPKVAGELLTLLDKAAATKNFDEANEVFKHSRDVLSFLPEKLADRYYRFIYEALAVEMLREWVTVMNSKEIKDHNEMVTAIDTALKAHDVTYSDKQARLFELTKKLMAYKQE